MLSSKAKYGLKAMLHLSEHGRELPVLISDIAAGQQIPKKFLDIILLELKNGGLLRSKKGKGGGYLLARAPDKITVGQIVRLLDGPLAPIACASRTAFRPCDDCRDVERCRVRLAMLEVRDAIAQVLDDMSLADLAGGRASVEAVLLYDI